VIPAESAIIRRYKQAFASRFAGDESATRGAVLADTKVAHSFVASLYRITSFGLMPSFFAAKAIPSREIAAASVAASPTAMAIKAASSTNVSVIVTERRKVMTLAIPTT